MEAQPLHVEKAAAAAATAIAVAMDTDMDSLQLVQKLVESFNAVAAELQTLTDRKTILEHKLRYAHEQVSHDCDGVSFSLLPVRLEARPARFHT